ncbi:MAG: ABC transporter permease [Anaerolineae bacterium]
MVKKELRSVSREKTIMIAIGIQLFIASFSSVVLVGLLSFYDPEAISANVRATIRVGVLGDPNSTLYLYLRTRNIRTVFFDDVDRAESAFESGGIDAIISIPANQTGLTEMKLVLPKSETRSAVILLLLKEPLKQFENDLRARGGATLNYTGLGGQPSTTFEFLYTVIVPVLMFFPAFVAGSMAVDSIAEEMENQTLDTLRAGPVSVNSIFGAKIVAALVLALIQCVAWLGLLRLNQIQIQNGLLVLVVALLIAALNAIGSALIAVALRDRERAQFVYSIALLGTVAVSTLLNLSPIGLLNRLATGDAFTGLTEVLIYGVIVLALLFVFFRATRRLTSS